MNYDSPNINFKLLNKKLVPYAKEIVQELLPGGKFRGREYVCSDLTGGPGSSLSINCETGLWKDFASGEAGDLIGLTAQALNINNLEAVKHLTEKGYLPYMNGGQKPAPTGPQPIVIPGTGPVPLLVKPPKGTPRPDFKIKPGFTTKWTYKNTEGEVLFFIARYDGAGEKKSFLPFCYSHNQRSWVNKMWPAPRPLYGLEFVGDSESFIIVEGEKACDAARTFKFASTVLTWSGGAQAIENTDFSPLKGKRVILWPDNDEPGIACMNSLALKLSGLNCKVEVINPVSLPPGHDCADMLGMAKESVVAFIRDNKKLYEPPVKVTKAEVKPVVLDKEQEDSPAITSFNSLQKAMGLEFGNRGVLSNFLNVRRAINYRYGDTFWFDTFYNKIVFTHPETKKTRPIKDIDYLNMYDYLHTAVKLSGATETHVLNAYKVLADSRKKSIVKEWISSLEWDNKPRIDSFFSTAMGVDDSEYTRAVSKNFWLSMVARVFNPGCQVDNMVVIHGTQGIKKTSALRAIGGEYFTTLHSKIDDKDFIFGMQGYLICEIGELASIRGDKLELMKSIITTPVDDVRRHYGRESELMPRQSVMVGTTNSVEWMQDATGSRRFWPITANEIDIDEIKACRELLFAEARVRYLNGETWWETPEEATREAQENHFETDSWEEPIREYCLNKSFVSFQEVTMCILLFNKPREITRVDQFRINKIFTRMGWVKGQKRHPEIKLFKMQDGGELSISTKDDVNKKGWHNPNF